MELTVKVIGAFIAIFTFAMVQETPKKYLWCAGVVGAVGGFVYVICTDNGIGTVMGSFLSALAIALLSHTFARIFKAPVTLFLIAGILPTVPGAGMYKIVYYLIAGDSSMASFYLIETIEIAGVIALAIFFMDTVFRMFQKNGWKQNSLKYVRRGTNEAKRKS